MTKELSNVNKNINKLFKAIDYNKNDQEEGLKKFILFYEGRMDLCEKALKF
jgi:hypothetical protein